MLDSKSLRKRICTSKKAMVAEVLDELLGYRVKSEKDGNKN